MSYVQNTIMFLSFLIQEPALTAYALYRIHSSFKTKGLIYEKRVFYSCSPLKEVSMWHA